MFYWISFSIPEYAYYSVFTIHQCIQCLPWNCTETSFWLKSNLSMGGEEKRVGPLDGIEAPKPPVISAGGVGGPVVYRATPARNARKIAAQDANLSSPGAPRRGGCPAAADGPTLRQWLAAGPYTLVMSSSFFGTPFHAGVLAALIDAGVAPSKVAGGVLVINQGQEAAGPDDATSHDSAEE